MTIKVANIEFFPTGITIGWDDTEEGWFGEVTIYKDKGKIIIDSETMGKEFIKELLNQLVDMAQVR